jgi:hypothetical protein
MMRSKELVMAAGLAAVLMSASACGPKTTTGGAANGAASPPAAQASGSTAAAAPTSAPAAPAGGTAPGASAAGATDVCSLMSSAQASAINHVTYGAATPQHVEAGWDTCTYANTGQHADPVDIQRLTVSVIALAGCYQQLKQTEGPGIPVAGIGDAAFGHQIGLLVNDGGRCIDITGLTDAELQHDYTHDVAMAKIIITALG